MPSKKVMQISCAEKRGRKGEVWLWRVSKATTVCNRKAANTDWSHRGANSTSSSAMFQKVDVLKKQYLSKAIYDRVILSIYKITLKLILLK